MTKITKLLFHGFKSFKNKTVLEFGDTFNCVLGPNGSGKSNIIDGLTFVLGRRSSKAMRAEKTANLIYHGGKSNTGSPSAEVSIFFDNKNKVFPIPDEELKVSRVVNKKGNSIYKINDQKSNRVDILNLLSHAHIDPDGYNIILQGDIIRFVEMATEERRKIIEEIAGINVYEDKKQQAVNELNKVDEKLNEANIILEERKTYLRELKKDRDQAQEYKDIRDNIGKYKLTLLTLQIEEREKKLQQLATQQQDRRSQIEKLRLQSSETEKGVAEKRKKIEDIDREIEQKGEKKQLELNKEIEALKIELATSQTRAENLDQELERMKKRADDLIRNKKELVERKTKLDREISDSDRIITTKQKDLEELDKKIGSFKQKNNVGQDISAIETQITEIEKQEESLQTVIQQLRQAQQSALREKDQLEVKLESMIEQEKKVTHLEKEQQSTLKDLNGLKKRMEKLTESLHKVLSEDSEFSVKLRSLNSELETINNQKSKIYAAQMNMKERFTGDKAVDEIISQKHKIKGIHGTVADIGTVKTTYRKALDVAAGGRLRNIVVDDDDIAKQCIDYLKRSKLGVATFLPLNKIRPPTSTIDAKQFGKKKGIHGSAIDLVEFNPDYEKVFRFVFGNTLVVDDIETAQLLGIGKMKMVTLDGDLIEQAGAMKGGHIKLRTAGFKETEVEEDLEKLEKRSSSLESSIQQLVEKKEKGDAQITTFRQEKAALEGEIIKVEKSLHISGDTDDIAKKKHTLGEQIEFVKKNIDEFQDRISKTNRELADLKTKKLKLRDTINQMQRPELLAQLSAFQAQKDQTKEKVMQLSAHKQSFEAQLSNIMEPELKKLDSILKESEKEEHRFRQMSSELKESVKQNSQVLKEKEKEAAVFYQRFKKLFQERDQYNNQIHKESKVLSDLERKTRDIEISVNNVVLEETRLKAECAGLNKQSEEFQGIEPFKSKDDLPEMQKTVSRLESKLLSLGNVNMRALEVYDNVELEYNKLLEKKDSLHKEKEDVLHLMAEIDEKKKEIFMKNFHICNDLFRSLFRKLTTKGDAFLELENDKDPFDGGVLIKVKITSKKFLDIKSLSGGEKTLTALAFIFSIQEHNPASFYILDEVDAALDKKNSEKLAELIRSYSGRAQYIVISHNDAIISQASNLYGISMDEHSTSKVTSLAL